MTRKKTNNTVFLEVLGTGGLISTINYERIFFSRTDYQISARLGGTYYFQNRNKEDVIPWSVPLELGLAIGSKNHLEIGTGLTYIYGDTYCTSCGHVINRQSASSTLFASVRVGYKYKKEKGHLYLNSAFTPLIVIREYNTSYPTRDEGVNIFFSFGIGYSF
jgi:hypothetical protein